MTISMIVVLAVGLSMDAFAVSLSNGMCIGKIPLWKNALWSGLAFGLFQGIMPLIGFFAGSAFSDLLSNLDHWIALILLSLIGGKMIWEAWKQSRCPEPVQCVDFSFKTLMIQAVATSIDALAVGVSLAMVDANIWASISLIALITFLFCFIAVFIGKNLGGILSDKAGFFGGAILIFIGLRIFITHIIDKV